MTWTRTLSRASALPAAVATAALIAGPAAAHLTMSPEGAAVGSYAVLTRKRPHGCDGSPTTEVIIQIP